MVRSPATKPKPVKPRKPVAKKPAVEAPASPLSVSEAVRIEVLALPLSLRGSVLALTAVHLAKILTETDAARDSAALARELRAVLTDLAAARANAVDKHDMVDEIGARRQKRRAQSGM